MYRFKLKELAGVERLDSWNKNEDVPGECLQETGRLEEAWYLMLCPQHVHESHKQ
jgi:hypothetical protein